MSHHPVVHSDALDGIPPVSRSAEAEVLLSCARGGSSAERDRRLEALLHETDGIRLGRLAERHRLGALLHATLERVAPDRLATAAMDGVRSAARETAARACSLGAELVELLGTFDDHGIRALSFTGPVLAQCVYGNVTLRATDQIDVLVAAHDVGFGRRLLVSRGYRAETRLLPAALTYRLDHRLRFVRTVDGVTIGLHWSVAPRTLAREVGIDQLWSQRLHTSLFHRPVACPSHEHSLLVLCINGAKHGWSRLDSICDVAELVRSKPLDWYRVLDEADAWRCGRMLRVGLLLAHQLLAAPVATFVLALSQSDDNACALAHEAYVNLFAPERLERHSSERRRFQLEIQEDAGEKLRVLCYWPIAGLSRRAMRLATPTEQVGVA